MKVRLVPDLLLIKRVIILFHYILLFCGFLYCLRIGCKENEEKTTNL